MKKKIYISLPIAFHEDTVYQRNQEAKDYLFNKFSNRYEWVSPIDNNHIDDEDLTNHLQIRKTAYYMGRDIEQVILCDAILMCPGWENSRGCQCEKFVAEMYGKEILIMNKGEVNLSFVLLYVLFIILYRIYRL